MKQFLSYLARVDARQQSASATAVYSLLCADPWRRTFNRLLGLPPPPHDQPTNSPLACTPQAWALTAEAAAEADAAEAEALLRFAESLDFQDYLDDSSKRDLGTALKTLAELEREDELKKYPLKEQTVWTESFVQAVNALVSEERDGLGELPAAAKAAGAASVASSAVRRLAVAGRERCAHALACAA